MIAGRYSLDREIGRGGTGAVWLGRDEVLGRQVALKRIGLLPGADSTDLARAEREARLSARLNHPHVVAVFDVADDAESQARWLVMQYVDGSTLSELVRDEGRLSPDDAAVLLWQAADALVAAHAAGIVHRDVKPSNILVDRNRQVMLTDFGIARVTLDPSLTQTGLVTGSPAYLAPEVATGGRGHEAADVWSLGVTLFHVLAGRPPYEIGDNVLGAMYRIVNEEPPRLDDAGWLTPLLEGTMVRDPEQRWSMEQVRDFLAAPPQQAVPTDIVEPTPLEEADEADGTRVLAPVTQPSAPFVLAPPTADSPEPRRPPARRLLIGLGVVVALVLLVAVVTSLSGRDPSSGPSASPGNRFDLVGRLEADQGGDGVLHPRLRVRRLRGPDTSWTMLTPKFQRESGGLDTYRRFWGGVTNGRVLSISADPANLTVSYQVRFDNFNNGPGPTVLDLKFEDGKYLIDGERTQGFKPAG